jgi:DNA-binding NtrC family response regulator
MDALQRHVWPGNVRELRNVVERAVVMCKGGSIRAPDIVLSDVGGRGRPTRAPDRASSPSLPAISHDDATKMQARDVDGAAGARPFSLKADLERYERERIEEALQRTQGNQSKAAELLGISRSALVKRLTAYAMLRRQRW